MTLTKEERDGLRATHPRHMPSIVQRLLDDLDAKDAEIECIKQAANDQLANLIRERDEWRSAAESLETYRSQLATENAALRAQLELLRVAGSHAVRITTAP